MTKYSLQSLNNPSKQTIQIGGKKRKKRKTKRETSNARYDQMIKQRKPIKIFLFETKEKNLFVNLSKSKEEEKENETDNNHR